MRSRSRLIAAAAVVALALLLRAEAARHDQSLWRDEANDVFLCRNSHGVTEMLRMLRTEGSPPLRFAVECAVHQVWPTSVVPARTMVVLFGAMADAVTIAVAWEAFGPEAAIIAGLLMAISPYFVRYSVELRGYSQFQLLAALYAFVLLRLMRRPALRNWMATGAVGAALSMTHYFGMLLVGAGTVAALVVAGDRRELQQRILASGAVTALLVAPSIGLLAAQLSPDLRPWSVPDRKGLDLVRAVLLPLGRWAAPLCALLMLGLWGRRRLPPGTGWLDVAATRDAHALLLAGALGANVAGWLVQFVPGLHARLEPPYLVGPAVWPVPSLGAAIMAIVGGTGGSHRFARTVSSLALLVGICVSQAADVRAWLRPRSPAPQIARVIAREGQPGDLILIMPPAHASSFNFYYDGALEQWAPPFARRITNMPWAGLLARMEDPEVTAGFVDALGDRLRRGGRIWVVSGGAGSLRLETASLDEKLERSTAYARALATTRRELLRVLYRYAQPVPVTLGSALDYWEPMEVALFEPTPGGRVSQDEGSDQRLPAISRATSSTLRSPSRGVTFANFAHIRESASSTSTR